MTTSQVTRVSVLDLPLLNIPKFFPPAVFVERPRAGIFPILNSYYIFFYIESVESDLYRPGTTVGQNSVVIL